MGSWGSCRRGVLAAGLGGVVASMAACTLIAGIDEGTLVNDGAGDGGKPGTDGGKGTGPDATKGDAAKGHDGGSAPDAKKGDGGAETGPPPRQLTCALVAGSKVTVDDLSRADAGGTTTFNGGLYVTPNGGSEGFGVLTELSGASGNQVVAYTVQGGNVATSLYPGSLVDVVTTGQTAITVLTSFVMPNGAGSSLSLLTGAQPGSLVAGSPFASIATASYQGGKVAPFVRDGGGAGMAYATFTQGGGSLPYALGFGFAGDSNGPHDVYEQDASLGFTNNGAFFASAGSLYGLLNQIQPASGQVADTVVSVSDTLQEGGITGALALPPNKGALIAARASVVTPNEAIIFGATVDDTGALTPCSATVPPAMVNSLTLCGTAFTVGAGQSMSSIAVGGAGGVGWNLTTDDLVIAGPNGTKTALNLAWLASDARVVGIVPSFIPTGNVNSTAVRFDEFVGDNTASNFDVAWIERNANPEGGTFPDKLFAAVVNCE